MNIPESIVELGPLFKKWLILEKNLKKLASKAGLEAGLGFSPRLLDPEDKFFEDFDGLCWDQCSFYECATCNEPYFGGIVTCGEAMRE